MRTQHYSRQIGVSLSGQNFSQSKFNDPFCENVSKLVGRVHRPGGRCPWGANSLYYDRLRDSVPPFFISLGITTQAMI